MDYLIVLIGLMISWTGCWFYSDMRKKEAHICWAISYPLSIYILIKAFIQIFR